MSGEALSETAVGLEAGGGAFHHRGDEVAEGGRTPLLTSATGEP
jgi:hypothetical protein